MPETVENFNCSNNKLTTVKGSPNEVTGYFACSNNKLTNLIGSPSHIGGFFNCSFNNLTTLDGSPTRVKSFICRNNKLTDLIGSPSHVGGCFDCIDNQLISLFGVSKYISSWISIRNNPNLLDVSDIWDSDIGGVIYFDLNPGMAIIPLIKFKSSCSYSGNATNEIHKRNQGSSKKNIIDFQYDLIENGFEDNARWNLLK